MSLWFASMECQHRLQDRFRGENPLPAILSRPFYHAGYRYPLHDHDFHEVFWVESGVILHTIDGHVEVLQPGEVRFMHPATQHALGADQASILVNVTLSSTLVGELASFAGTLPFTAGAAPGFRLGPDGRMALAQWSERLADPQLDRLQVGSFLLWLLAESRKTEQPAGDASDAWLGQALASFNHPGQLATGVNGLARIAGRSTGHLARAVRRRYGCTTIQLINRRRLAWLAQELRNGGEEVADLAVACGLANLANCYQQFRAAYGCPPGEYRRRAQLDLGDLEHRPQPGKH